MSVGAWITLAAGLLTLGMMFSGFWQNRVTQFKNRVELLEKSHAECEEAHKACRRDLKALWRWAMWAQNNYVPRSASPYPPPLPEINDGDENLI